MKKITAIFLGLYVYTSCLIPQNMFAQQRPNIILFLVDDMGWQDTSVPFWTRGTEWNKRYHTPNMERLAKAGMKFTNAYAAPVCSPSRVSLMTGMNAAHHMVTNWTLRKNDAVDVGDSLLQPPAWNINGMSPVAGVERTILATPLPMLLKKNDYYTIHCGKAHFGAIGTPAADPLNMGFMVNIAGHAAGGPGSYLGEQNYGNEKNGYTLPWGVPGLKPYHGSGTFLTEALTKEALKALEIPISQKQPFFLYMAHYAVHVPYASDPRFIQKYLDLGLALAEAQYAAIVEGMDKSLGDIMDFLEQKKIAGNTIILFMSDNGGYAGSPRSGLPFTQNSPLKAGKGSVYEGGIREPMIVKWPGVVKPSSTAKQYLIIEDYFPTLLEMAGIKKYSTIQKFDGRSFMSILKNPDYTDNERVLVWHFPNKWIRSDDYGVNFRSAVRQGDWKLIFDQKTYSRELYNLKDDIGEKHDLSGTRPIEVALLSRLLSERLRRWQAGMPEIKATGKAVLMPDLLP